MIVGGVSDALGGRRAAVVVGSTVLLSPLLWVMSQFSDVVRRFALP